MPSNAAHLVRRDGWTGAYDCMIDGINVGGFCLYDGYVCNFIVDEKHRGKGYGHTMMSLLIAMATSGGYKRLTLIVDISNRAALSIYKHAGFTIASNYWDNLRMERAL